MVGLGGLEPPTSRLSGVRSSQLSYKPIPSKLNSLKVKDRPRKFRGSRFEVRGSILTSNFELRTSQILLRKEVIQPHLPIRLPCYDFTPITNPTLDGSLHVTAVKSPASGVADFRGVTGGVYKARERIHRSMLTCDY